MSPFRVSFSGLQQGFPAREKTYPYVFLAVVEYQS